MSMKQRMDEMALLADLAMYAFHKDRIAALGKTEITEAALKARLKALGLNDDGSRMDTSPLSGDPSGEPKE